MEDLLKLSESIIDLSPHGVLVVSSKGLILKTNEKFCELFNANKIDATNTSLNYFLLDDSFETIVQEFHNQGENRQAIGIKSNGINFPVELIIHRFPYFNNSFFVFFVRDFNYAYSEEIAPHQYKIALDTSPDIVFILDADTLKINFVNQGAVDQLGYSKSQLIHMRVSDLKPEFNEARFRSLTDPLRYGQSSNVSFETILRRSNGSVFEVEVAIQYVETGKKSARFFSVVRDITERKAYENELIRLAFNDELTGLANRRKIFNDLDQVISTCQLRESFSAALLIDIDNFKTINDTLGHKFGDEVLVETAGILKDIVGLFGKVARLGGDEFLIILNADPDRDNIKNTTSLIASQILNGSDKTACESLRYRSTTKSIGVVVFGEKEASSSDVVRKADIAMYDAKNKGKDRASFFNNDMQQLLLKEQELVKDLSEALSSTDQIVAWFQPTVNADGGLVGFEALARWQHPSLGIVPPGQFIEVAENNKLGAKLCSRIMEFACTQMAIWHREFGLEGLWISVNISQRSLAMPEFPGEVAEILDRSSLPADMLKLEIVETLLAENIEVSIENMNAIRKLGVQFSLDDFGTGYSSLSYIQKLPISEIKVDQTFIANLLHDSSVEAIVKAVIDISASLNLKVVAEGIEKDGQWHALLDLGCKFFQGYFFGCPRTASMTEQLLRERLGS